MREREAGRCQLKWCVQRQWCGQRIGQQMMGGRRGVNRELVPPVGHFMWALVMLFVGSIDPSREVSVRVSFNWILKYDADDEGFC